MPVVREFLSLLIVILLSTRCFSVSSGVNRLPRLRRMVGGSDAVNGTAPYQASLRVYDIHFCGGSIIHAHWILTAGHCIITRYFSTALENVTVVVGTHSLDSDGTPYYVQKFVKHEGHVNEPHLNVNDIALLRLTEDIVFGALIQPIKLPSNDTGRDVDLVFTGWGDITFKGNNSNHLQIMKVKSMDAADCILIYSMYSWMGYGPDRPVLTSNICTQRKSGAGVCNGDSGGPLVDGDRLVGIASWTVKCAIGYPDVYTRVYSYLNWIQEHIHEDKHESSHTSSDSLRDVYMKLLQK